MNRYSLNSDSNRWWYPTAIAGTIGTAAVGVILLVPVIGAQATTVETPTDGSGSVTINDRPCYLTRAGWNTPARWEQPVCTTLIRHGAAGPAPVSHRVLSAYLP